MALDDFGIIQPDMVARELPEVGLALAEQGGRGDLTDWRDEGLAHVQVERQGEAGGLFQFD